MRHPPYFPVCQSVCSHRGVRQRAAAIIAGGCVFVSGGWGGEESRTHGTAAAHAAHAAPAAQSCSSTNGASIPTGQREYSPLFVLARGRFLAGPCIPPRCPDRGGARINSTGGGTRAQSAGKSVRTTRRGIPGTGNRGVAPVARARAPSGFPFGKYYAILGAVCGCRCVPVPAAFSVAVPWRFPCGRLAFRPCVH